MSEKQQELVANLFRFHRKEFPSSADENFKALSLDDCFLVNKFSELMRLADGMDISHTGLVRGVRLDIKNDGKRELVEAEKEAQNEPVYPTACYR